MKAIHIFISLILLGLLLSCNKLQHKKIDNYTSLTPANTFTIRGQVIVEGSNIPLKGLNIVNIKNRWKHFIKQANIGGENERVFVNTQGYYEISVKKGDTIIFSPNEFIYKTSFPNYIVTNFDKDMIVNFQVQIDSTRYKERVKSFPEVKEKLDYFLNNINPDKLYTIQGIIKDKHTKKPLKNIIVSSNFDSNTNRISTHNLTDEYGYFSMTYPENQTITISPLIPEKRLDLQAIKDTLIEILY